MNLVTLADVDNVAVFPVSGEVEAGLMKFCTFRFSTLPVALPATTARVIVTFYDAMVQAEIVTTAGVVGSSYKLSLTLDRLH